MVAEETPVCDFDRPAIDFDLPAVDGRRYTLADCRGERGIVVVFLANRCKIGHWPNRGASSPARILRRRFRCHQSE